MSKSLTLLLLACLLLATASAHPGHKHVKKVKKAVSVFDIISASKQHTILKAGLIATKLDKVLKDSNFTGTVFAPTDAAFLDFLRKSGLSAQFVLTNPNNSVALTLLYHVTAAVIPASAIAKAPRTSKVVTLFPNNTLRAYSTSKAVIISAFGSNARVLKADIMAKKAIVHVIDTVLIPNFLGFPGCKSPAAVITGLKLTNLVTAVKMAGLLKTLNDKDFTGTILAPTDKAFATLLAALKTTPAKIDKKLLTTVLLYHVIGLPVPAKYVKNNAIIPTLSGFNLTSIIKKGIFFKGGASTAKVVSADYFSCKAVIHVIDTVLLPKL